MVDNCWYKDVCQNEPCTDACLRYIEMKYLMEHSNLPPNKQKPLTLIAPDIDYDAFCRLSEIKSDIVNYVNNGHNLFITSSETGNGKTSWAIKMLLKFFDSVWYGNCLTTRGLFISVPMFLLQCKNFDKKDAKFEELKSLILDVDLVVWDDLASANISGYDYSQLLSYIDYRILSCKSNIYTGNICDKNLLDEALGKRLSSRVWNSSSDIITLRGSDYRNYSNV